MAGLVTCCRSVPLSPSKISAKRSHGKQFKEVPVRSNEYRRVKGCTGGPVCLSSLVLPGLSFGVSQLLMLNVYDVDDLRAGEWPRFLPRPAARSSRRGGGRRLGDARRLK